jgi:ribonuclease G
LWQHLVWAQTGGHKAFFFDVLNMKSELIVDVCPNEVAIALTEDDRLMEVNREQRGKDTFAVGNIYYGRVKKVMPALNAAFVDVGHEKEAFLHYLDLGSGFLTTQKYVTKLVSDRRRIPEIHKIERQPECTKEGQIADYLKVGDTLLVQVTKEPINSKGPRLSAEISITGRNFVLIPFIDKVMVSNKISREAERGRLKQLVHSIKPHGFGVIVRTVAEDKRVAELDNELSVLLKRWEDCVRTLQYKEPVSLITQELGRTIGIIRDIFSPEFQSIHVNDQIVYEEIKQYLDLIAPEASKVVKLYKGDQPIFDKFDITRQMKTGLGRTVGFKKGGYLIMDKTEALFSIDVNSGSKKLFADQEQNAFHFNMLAADEIVHQLRLRDIGGIIVVDFIDMDDKGNQQALYDHMRELMSHDRAKHNILPLSKFGLMQITRQRVRPAVEMEVMETCPTCLGKGKIQASLFFTEQIEEQLEAMVAHYGRGLRLHLHPFIYAYISKGWISTKRKWTWKYGVRVIENQKLGMLDAQFFDRKGVQQHLPNTEDKAPEKQ